MDRKKTSGVVPIAVALLIISPLLYVGGYVALLEPPPRVITGTAGYPTYRIGGEVSNTAFAPAFMLHQWLRRIGVAPSHFVNGRPET